MNDFNALGAPNILSTSSLFNQAALSSRCSTVEDFGFRLLRLFSQHPTSSQEATSLESLKKEMERMVGDVNQNPCD